MFSMKKRASSSSPISSLNKKSVAKLVKGSIVTTAYPSNGTARLNLSTTLGDNVPEFSPI
jgi:hypothetical protein